MEPMLKPEWIRVVDPDAEVKARLDRIVELLEQVAKNTERRKPGRPKKAVRNG